MKFLKFCVTTACLGLGIILASPAVAAEKTGDGAKTPMGSIRPVGKVSPRDLPSIAKLSFKEALQIAIAEVPGSVIKAELEIEDGNLQYSFEIVGADKSLTEVEVDAGNGSVLDKDREVLKEKS